MKHLRDLKPCANCGGPVGALFYIVRASLAMVHTGVVNEYLGMHQFFGGRAPAALVENFVPGAEQAVTVAGDKEPSLMAEVPICMTCYHQRGLDLPLLIERVREQDPPSAPQRRVTS